MARSTVAYLDTNAWSYFFPSPHRPDWPEDRLAPLRRGVRDAVRAGRLVVVGTPRHLEELSRIIYRDATEYARFVEFFWSVVLWNFLLPTDELLVAEAAVGRPLEREEPFDEWNRRQAIKRATRNIEWAASIGEATYLAMTGSQG